LKRRNHVLRVLDRLAAIERGADLCVDAAFLNHRFNDIATALQARRVNVHQHDGRVLERGSEQNVIAQIARKDKATRADQGDFQHEGRSPFGERRPITL
jgi:hypothetical protein